MPTLNKMLYQKPKRSKWYVEYICPDCEHTLTTNDIYFSNGVCQYCGKDGGDASRTHYEKIIWRKVYTYRYPWWMIWKKDLWHIEYKPKSKWSKQ